ncbi:MAG: EF-hand domain-containing protein [Burkholderiales bacterium]
MNLKYAIGAALAAGVFTAIPVSAADTSSDSSRIDRAFTALDQNHDGSIDQTEAQARPWLQQNFSQYDTNHDSKLGKDEFAAAMNAERTARGGTRGGAGASADTGRYFDSLDKNNDGNIDPTEAQAVPWLQQNFSQYDMDHNGKLGKDEFAAAMNAQHAARGNAPGAAGASSNAASQFDSLDKNNDGGIDQTEAQTLPWLQQNFSQYDTNHDGKLGKDEFAAAVAAQPR